MRTMIWGGAGLALAVLAASPAMAQDAAPAETAATLNHVAIRAVDQQKSVDFYQGLFHLPEIPSPFPPGGPRWLVLGNGVELHIQPGATERIVIPRAAHFAITVPSLDPVIAWLKAHDMGWVDSADRPGQIAHTRSDGVQQIFVQDPDGYWIEINDVGRQAP